MVSTHFERAYHLHKDHIRANPSKETCRDAVVGFINIAYGWLSEKRYAQGLVWTERFGMLIEDYKQRFDGDEAYIDKQWARYKIFSAMNLSKARDIVEKLRSEVNNFRNGAEPNDDLTMLCLKYYYEPEA